MNWLFFTLCTTFKCSFKLDWGIFVVSRLTKDTTHMPQILCGADKQFCHKSFMDEEEDEGWKRIPSLSATQTKCQPQHLTDGHQTIVDLFIQRPYPLSGSYKVNLIFFLMATVVA